MLEDVIAQQRPILIYDSCYPSVAKIALDAKAQGYDIHILAPGFAESGVCNPLSFIKDSTDAEAAHQLATDIHKIGLFLKSETPDSFFAQSSLQLIQAILMLSKDFERPDIMTAFTILESDCLTQRLMAASLNPWVKTAFAHIFSTVGTNTNAEIINTAHSILEYFTAAHLISGCFIDQTSIPLSILDKQLIILGFNTKEQKALILLMSSILKMIINYNSMRNCFHPLIITTDEFPFNFLPKDISISLLNSSFEWDENSQEEWNRLASSMARKSIRRFLGEDDFDLRKLEVERKFPHSESLD